jgi:hypothetical protein
MLQVLQLYNFAVRAASWRLGPDQISCQEVEGFFWPLGTSYEHD